MAMQTYVSVISSEGETLNSSTSTEASTSRYLWLWRADYLIATFPSELQLLLSFPHTELSNPWLWSAIPTATSSLVSLTYADFHPPTTTTFCKLNLTDHWLTSSLEGQLLPSQIIYFFTLMNGWLTLTAFLTSVCILRRPRGLTLVKCIFECIGLLISRLVVLLTLVVSSSTCVLKFNLDAFP